jgi:hypothetical protein
MEPGSPSPYPQVPASCPYPEPTPSSPHDPSPTSGRSILILSSHLRLGLPNGVDSDSNRNNYQEYFLEGKGVRCVVVTTLLSLCTDCLGILRASNSSRPKGLSRPVMGLLYVYCKEFPLFIQFKILLSDGIFVLRGLPNYGKSFTYLRKISVAFAK